MRVLKKIGDADRAIGARLAKLFKKYEKPLKIKGVTAEGMLKAVRKTEAIVPNEALALEQHGRLTAARMVADDELWTSVLKIHKRVQVEAADDESLANDFAFLAEYMKKRRGTRDPGGAPPGAAGSGK